MKIILLLLSFIYALDIFPACVPGSVPCESAGIQNFKVQNLDPTFTASPGEKGLFNTNSQFKTKDEFGNIQRLVRDSRNLLSLGNGDMEEGLTGYAGIGTLNTTTPLQGLKSINLDTTALNDFMETALVTLPPILFGNTCMARINIRGGDANLQFQVVNGAGTIISTGQFASPFTDSTPQHLVFACPTQAEITATPALGQLKIRIIQSTAVNAALATLDMFYLGELDAQTMAVTEGSQWYYYTANADINGNFPFPAPTASTNDKTLFTYTGTTLTALKSANISFDISANMTITGVGSNTFTSVTCIINGISRIISSTSNIVSGVNSNLYTGAFPTINLSAGDSCSISITRANETVTDYRINITATPLSQIATVVPTTQTRAGFYAGKDWAVTTGCRWVGTGAVWGDFPLDPECDDNARVLSGFAISDAASDGQLPQITLSKYPKGNYLIVFTGALYTVGGSGSCGFRVSDGTNTSAFGEVSSSAGDSGGSVNTFSFRLKNTIDQNSATIKLQKYLLAATSCDVFSESATRMASINIYYEPDLSDSTEGITVNKMLPIVQGSETVVESFRATNGSGTNQNLYWTTVQENTISKCGTIVNDSTSRFSYTAKIPCLVNFSANGYSTGLLGIDIQLNGVTVGYDDATSGGHSSTANVLTKVGDIITVRGAGAGGITSGGVSPITITATSFGKPGVITSDAVVTNSGATTARKWRTESCYVLNGGTASLGSPSCSSWIQSVSRTGVGIVAVNFITNTWSQPPVCTCTGYDGGTGLCVLPPATTASINSKSYNANGGAALDWNHFINCQGL